MLDSEGLLAERHALVWRYDADLWITAVWGTPDGHDVERVLEAYRQLIATQGRFRAFLDFSRLTQVDPAAFESLATFMRDHKEHFEARVVWQAVVIPSGMLGALVSGFHAALGYRIDNHVFESVEEAVKTMFRPGEAEEMRTRMLPRLAELAQGELVDRIRGALRRQPRHDVDAIARLLAVSRRTLQRELARVDTSFREERLAIRIALAKERLQSSGASLEEVARELGFGSRQELTRQFTKVVGKSPSEFRGG